MTPRTLNDIFFRVADRSRYPVMLHRQAIDWVPIMPPEFSRKILAISSALLDWGISKGDRVAILSENRPEWSFADFATLLIGGVVVPIYSTLTASQTAFILNDSGARIVFVSTEQQLQKILAVQDQLSIEKIVVMDGIETARAIHLQRLFQSNDQPAAERVAFLARQVTPDEPATLIYTSGTTGTSKGVVLTHGNLASNIACSLHKFGVGEGEIDISFLPLSHVTARHVDFAMLYHGVTLAYVPFPEQLPQALLEVHPSIFVAVPRVYEKIHAQTDRKASAWPKRWIYRWALSVGHRHRSQTLRGEVPVSHSWKLADRLVYSKIRAGLGGRARLFISGGAPLGRELAEWYADLGIRIHEGYGLTETSPVIAVNTPQAHKLGTVGRPLDNVEVRIAPDGEILVRGPSVFQGYWKREAETSDAFADGWFKTGDIGHLDSDGFLCVTDRKRDLIKTSGGKFIAPQPIENSLKHNALVAEAAVVGDKRKFPAVLIAPYFPVLEDWAHANLVPFTSRLELVQNPRIQALYDGIVADLNHSLARFEQLKRVLLVADEFSAQDGTLTPSMKMRRRVIEERYRQQLDALYVEADRSATDSP